jgi:hypothetical protein
MSILSPQPQNSTPSIEFEPFLTVTEVAQILRVSPDTVSRQFANQPGVVNLGRTESRRKRLYRQLRIPLSVLNRFLAARRVRCK